jgi:putative hydrolase of the HAD superfamily
LFGLPYGVFEEAAERAGLTPKTTLLGYADYQSFVRRQIRRDPELVKLFGALHDLGLSIGIASDGTTPEQLETLRRLGVLPYVDAVAISDRVGVAKPNPRLFRAVLKGLGVKPGETVHVGDSWERDVVGAQKCRLRTVYVVRRPTGRRSRKGVPVIALGNLEALLRLLAVAPTVGSRA